VRVSSLTRWAGRGLRAALVSYSRLTAESEGVDEGGARASSSQALPERIAVPRSEPSASDVEEHQPNVRGDHHDDNDRE
jgi:hypothetical protein